MRSPVLASLALLVATTAVVAAPDGLSDREAAQLKQQLSDAATQGNWPRVAELMPELARANDKKTWELLVRVAERAPETFDCASALRASAEVMDDRRAVEAIKKTAVESRDVGVRRKLVLHVARLRDWATLIQLMGDRDEQVASIAAWRLIDERVEEAVDPMIALMERLDRTHDGIWDVLRNGLGRLLGQRLGSGVEYRSRWEVVKQQGGLTSVQPAAREPVETTPEGGGGSQVRLFGREIDCTRLVFILDVSGSMMAIDPEAQDPADAGSQTRGGGPSGTTEAPRGKTRLQRAQEELKRVLERLPESTRVNIITYSSEHQVRTWRGADGDKPPQVHAMTAANKREACAFVDTAEADGTTATDLAITRAFEVEGARCFYLLSDGAATRDGTTPIPTEEIIGAIDEHGKDRHVTIHTLGFRGADREAMMRIAEHTGGKYSDIR